MSGAGLLKDDVPQVEPMFALPKLTAPLVSLPIRSGLKDELARWLAAVGSF